jgi:hypothetical protein
MTRDDDKQAKFAENRMGADFLKIQLITGKGCGGKVFPPADGVDLM